MSGGRRNGSGGELPPFFLKSGMEFCVKSACESADKSAVGKSGIPCFFARRKELAERCGKK